MLFLIPCNYIPSGIKILRSNYSQHIISVRYFHAANKSIDRLHERTEKIAATFITVSYDSYTSTKKFANHISQVKKIKFLQHHTLCCPVDGPTTKFTFVLIVNSRLKRKSLYIKKLRMVRATRDITRLLFWSIVSSET